MRFSRKAVSLTGRIGVSLSVLAALLVAGVVYLDEAREATAATRMLTEGVHVVATPTYGTSSTRKSRRGGATTTYTVRYAFWDRRMHRFDGSDTATSAEYAALLDPARPGALRSGASIAVVHDRSDPSRNGLRSRYEARSAVDYVTIGIALALTLGVALLVVGIVHAFLRKRMMVDVMPAPAWQPPSTA